MGVAVLGMGGIVWVELDIIRQLNSSYKFFFYCWHVMSRLHCTGITDWWTTTNHCLLFICLVYVLLHISKLTCVIYPLIVFFFSYVFHSIQRVGIMDRVASSINISQCSWMLEINLYTQRSFVHLQDASCFMCQLLHFIQLGYDSLEAKH